MSITSEALDDLWKQYDPNNEGYVPYKNLAAMLNQIFEEEVAPCCACADACRRTLRSPTRTYISS
jgi:hypothetical protein